LEVDVLRCLVAGGICCFYDGGMAADG